MLQLIQGDQEHLLGLTRDSKVEHQEADGFHALVDVEITEVKAPVFGRSIGSFPTHATIVSHFLEGSGHHGTLETVELAGGEVADAERIANTPQEDGGIVYPGTPLGYVA